LRLCGVPVARLILAHNPNPFEAHTPVTSFAAPRSKRCFKIKMLIDSTSVTAFATATDAHTPHQRIPNRAR
jgi:hypothetical protein